METKKLNIYQKLQILREHLPDFYVADAQGYKFTYASGAQILKFIKQKMDELKILAIPKRASDIKVTTHMVTTDRGQHTEYLVEALVEYVWINTEANNPIEDSLTIPWMIVGTGTNPSQALGAALTYSERYFFQKFFNIPTDEDDPDNYQKQSGNNFTVKQNFTPQKSALKTNFDGQIKKLTDEELIKFGQNVYKTGINAGKTYAQVCKSNPNSIKKWLDSNKLKEPLRSKLQQLLNNSDRLFPDSNGDEPF